MLRNLSYFLLLTVILLGFGYAPATAQERFIDNGDGTVTDRQTGLMWSRTDNKADILWQEAAGWIRDRFAGSTGKRYDNWRLPTVKELQGLYLDRPDYGGYRTACGYEAKMTPQIQISCILIWSSDSALGLPVAFNFYLGNAFTVDVNDNAGCRVLAVRNHQ